MLSLMRARGVSVGAAVRRCSTSVKEARRVEVKEEEEQFRHMKPDQKKYKKLEPFVKNLFLGRFDATALQWPRALDKDQHETLEAMYEPVEKFFAEEVDSALIDRQGVIPEETLAGVKALGLYGQQIPVEYGGLGLGATEFSRLSEAIFQDGSIGVTLAAHQSIGLKGLLIAGSPYLKEKYLPRLATGELTAAFCLTEPGSGSDAGSIQTRARLADDGKTWLLTGGKVWITNGGTADVMTVFARTEVEGQDKITAFFVERAFGGVTSGKPEDKMGIRGSNTCEVHFDNTPVPAENIVGELGRGFKLAVTILNAGRFSMGTATSGVLKRCMQTAIAHATQRKQFGHPLSDFALMKEKFARTALAVYAMESMAYLSAGIIDTYEDQDTAVEAAIVKVYSSSMGWELGSEMLQVLGGLGYMRDYNYERFLRDGRISLIFEGTNEILRIFIALMGIQHASPTLKEAVKKLRNPLMHPNFALRTALREVRDRRDAPKLTQDVVGNLHPALALPGEQLAYCVERLRYAVQSLLVRYGADVVQPRHQRDVARVADCAIDLYAMTAVLGRASRAKVYGIHNADHEVLLATTFCAEADARVRSRISGLLKPDTSDVAYADIADALFAKGAYVAEHPLTTNVN